jgi:hypothetical protein
MAKESQGVRIPWVVRRRRLAGRIMLGVAAFGLVVTVVTTAVAWLAVDRAGSTIEDTLEVTVSALDSIEQTIQLADGVIVSTSAGMARVNEALGVTSDSFATASRLLDELAAISEALPAQVDAVAGDLEGVASAADVVDRAMAVVSSLPLVPDLPDAALGDAVRSVRDELLPVATDLGALSGDLGEAASNADRLSGHVAALDADLGAVRASLEEAVVLVDRYAASAAEARRVAENALADNSTAFRWLKVMLVIVGVAVAAGQFVPAWLGWYLVATSPPHSHNDDFTAAGALPS